MSIRAAKQDCIPVPCPDDSQHPETRQMRRPHGTNKLRPTIESLEGRALLSGAAHALPTLVHSAVIGHLHTSGFNLNSAGSAAVLNAITGGMGSEVIKLIQHEVKNVGAVLSGFMSGRLTQ